MLDIEKIKESALFIEQNIPSRPEIAILLGSGLGGLVEEIQNSKEIPYKDIPNFPVSTVQGHRGTLIFGTLNNTPVLVMSGRFHYYEGYSMQTLTFPIQVFSQLGIKKIILSNAAGGLNPSFDIADIMIIRDLDKIDEPFETQTLVTVGGPYTNNRMTGLSKLNDDGYAVSGELYVNSLFGANPKEIHVEMEYVSGNKEVILTKCTKSVPGYSVYKMRFRDEGLEPGRLIVTCVFGYIGKSISVVSEFNVNVADGKNSKAITITEGGVKADLQFDENLNNTGFDEALFDPSEDDETL